MEQCAESTLVRAHNCKSHVLNHMITAPPPLPRYKRHISSNVHREATLAFFFRLLGR